MIFVSIGQLTDEDEDEVLRELEALSEEGFDAAKLPLVPSHELPGTSLRPKDQTLAGKDDNA